MLGAWCVRSVSSDHCAHSGLRPGSETDNMSKPRAVCFWLHDCTVWSDNADSNIFQSHVISEVECSDEMSIMHNTPNGVWLLEAIFLLEPSSDISPVDLKLVTWIQISSQISPICSIANLGVSCIIPTRSVKVWSVATGKWGAAACRWIHRWRMCYVKTHNCIICSSLHSNSQLEIRYIQWI